MLTYVVLAGSHAENVSFDTKDYAAGLYACMTGLVSQF